MGLISFIKRLLGFTETTTQVISAGGNFRFVAQNIATIYCIVEHSSFGKTLTKEQKMYAAALIDMYAYLSKGAYQPIDVAMAVDYARGGIVSLFPHNKVHGLLDRNENADLVNLSMQLEAMIFSVDTNVPDKEIVDMVVSEKSTISDAVNQIVSQGSNGAMYKKMYTYVQQHLSDPSLQNIVLVCENFQDKSKKSHSYVCKDCGKQLTALHTRCDYCGGTVELI